MAFFKFRKQNGAAEASAAATMPMQSVEELRRRAKYRLAGAAVLVLIGVVGLPLLLDGQPRPISVNTPIDIPDRDKVLPLVLPTPVAKPDAVAVVASAVPSAQAVTSVAAASETAKAPVPKQEKTSAAVTATAVVASAQAPAAKPKDESRAQLILEARSDAASLPVVAASQAKPDAAAAADQRFVVQVGAFADQVRAHEVRLKVEKAGLKTYTQVVQTKDGRRIRVRVGPFATKTDAERVVTKIKKLDLPAALLIL